LRLISKDEKFVRKFPENRIIGEAVSLLVDNRGVMGWGRMTKREQITIDDALRDLPEAAALLEQATRLVNSRKADHGKPMLSPAAAHDLAG
jgi:hypothetical protein